MKRCFLLLIAVFFVCAGSASSFSVPAVDGAKVREVMILTTFSLAHARTETTVDAFRRELRQWYGKLAFNIVELNSAEAGDSAHYLEKLAD
ncbi:MAG: hypothetical protein PHI85_07835 [Victivallaceae bacterium]|nr:hypothetical protein [Victivallaceae bacterium]